MSCHYTCETEEPTLACSIQAGDVVHVKSLKHNVPVYIVRSLKTKKMGIFPGIHPVFVYKPDYQPQLQPSSALQRIPDMIPPDQKGSSIPCLVLFKQNALCHILSFYMCIFCLPP